MSNATGDIMVKTALEVISCLVAVGIIGFTIVLALVFMAGWYLGG